MTQPPPSPLRIVLFTCGELGLEAADQIARLNGVESVTVVATPYRKAARHGIEKLRHVLKYNGMPDVMRAVWGSMRASAHTETAGIADRIASSSLNVLSFADFHEPECIAAVTALAPDLGVVVGTYILKPSVFAIPRLGSINLHTGKAPQYRGSAPGFWEMYNGETCVGITVHRVAAEVDAGEILRQEIFPFENAPAGDALTYLRTYRQEVLGPNGLRMLVATVRDIIDDASIALAQDQSNARTYRIPTHRQKRELRRRVSMRRKQGWKRNLKRAAGWLMFRSGLYRRLTAGKAIVVLFHRVDDRYARNPISCTTAQFQEYCRFFAQYFDVISVAQLCDLIERKGDLSGKLVITFDDGYADNLDAARMLRAHGLPACFFIATDFIGSERDGWWDVQQGLRSHWMSWDDVRQLNEWGFEIGAHTRNHIDLGVVTGPDAVAEITGSKNILETHLGATVDLFAYPYGSRRNITPDNLSAIRAAGFRSCMSAYGGFVTAGSNLFDLHRYAVSPWHRSLWQFGLEMIMEPSGEHAVRSLMPGTRADEPRIEVHA